MGDRDRDDETTVYVYPLTSNLTKDHVREIFGNFGKVMKVDFQTLVKDGSEITYGVVEFEKYDDAKYSVNHLNEGEIDGVKVRVNFRKPRP